MGEVDPCSKEIYMRIYEEEKVKIQIENRSRLRMKSFRAKEEQVLPEKFIGPEKVQKVVRQPIATILLDKVSALFLRTSKPSSL